MYNLRSRWGRLYHVPDVQANKAVFLDGESPLSFSCASFSPQVGEEILDDLSDL